jgi:hypothetical protein
MPTTTQLRTLLEEAGQHEVPTPRPEFIAELETFLVGDVAATEKVQGLLEHAGEVDVPAPRPEFVAALEARLLSQGATVARPISLVARDERPTRSRVVPAMVSAAAAVAAVVLAASLAGVFGEDPAQRQLELTSAIDTEIVLPGGETVEAEPGQELPDGTQVQTGDNGSATVGNVDIGPNQIATIEGGRIEITVPDLPLPVDTTLPQVNNPLTGGPLLGG